MNHPTFKSLTLGIGLFFILPLVYANSSFPSLDVLLRLIKQAWYWLRERKTHRLPRMKSNR